MADSKTKPFLKATDYIWRPENEASYGQLREEMYDCLSGVSHLLLTARLQAREADIRARYAKQFAERSVAEAKSAHQVSEALAKTARVIASIALEFANKTDVAVDDLNFLDPCIKSEMFSSKELQTMATAKQCIEMNKSDDIVINGQLTPTEKYSTTFPPDMLVTEQRGKHFETSPKLATVWECSPLIECNNDEEDDEFKDNEQAVSDNHRKMQIYKDSRRVNKSLETGDAQYEPTEYVEMGMQPAVN